MSVLLPKRTSFKKLRYKLNHPSTINTLVMSTQAISYSDACIVYCKTLQALKPDYLIPLMCLQCYCHSSHFNVSFFCIALGREFKLPPPRNSLSYTHVNSFKLIILLMLQLVVQPGKHTIVIKFTICTKHST